MEPFEKEVRLIKGGFVLELGAGWGEFFQFVNAFSSFDKLIAVDILEERAARIKEGFCSPLIIPCVMDGKNLGFKNEVFDTVCISNTLHHLRDVLPTLREMIRVLNYKGTFLINEPYSDCNEIPQRYSVELHQWWIKVDTALGLLHRPLLSREEIIKYVDTLELSRLRSYDYILPMRDADITEHLRLLRKHNEYVDKIRGHEKYNELKREGERLMSLIEKNGFVPEPHLLFVGKKRNNV